MTTRRLISAPAVVLLGLLSLHLRAPAQSRTAASPAKATPLTLDDVLHLLPSVSRVRLLELLNKRGVSFQATPENLNRLQQAKTPQRVLDVITHLAISVPAPKQAEPPKPKATISVRGTCSPPECQIVLNENEKSVETLKGEYKLDGLNPERVSIAASRNGYIPANAIVNLTTAKPGQEVVKDFKLQPTEATQAIWGSDLLKSTLDKAHIGAGSAFQVSGVLIIKEAQTAQWDVVAHLTSPGVAELEMSDPHTHVSLSCTDGICQISANRLWRKSPFPGATKQEKLLQENFLLRHTERWLANEYSSVILRLNGPHVTAISPTDPQGTSPETFQVGTPAGAYAITLDDKQRPKSVEFAAAAGLTAHTVITYKDYKDANGIAYPTITELKFTDNDTKVLSFASRGAVREGGNATKNK